MLHFDRCRYIFVNFKKVEIFLDFLCGITYNCGMGNFSKRFKFMNRHKHADFSRPETLVHWKRELVELMIRSGMVTFKNDPDEEADKNVSEHTD